MLLENTARDQEEGGKGSLGEYAGLAV